MTDAAKGFAASATLAGSGRGNGLDRPPLAVDAGPGRLDQGRAGVPRGTLYIHDVPGQLVDDAVAVVVVVGEFPELTLGAGDLGGPLDDWRTGGAVVAVVHHELARAGGSEGVVAVVLVSDGPLLVGT